MKLWDPLCLLPVSSARSGRSLQGCGPRAPRPAPPPGSGPGQLSQRGDVGILHTKAAQGNVNLTDGAGSQTSGVSSFSLRFSFLFHFASDRKDRDGEAPAVEGGGSGGRLWSVVWAGPEAPLLVSRGRRGGDRASLNLGAPFCASACRVHDLPFLSVSLPSAAAAPPRPRLPQGSPLCWWPSIF